jgi:hypothetical protein
MRQIEKKRRVRNNAQEMMDAIVEEFILKR